MKPDDRTAPKGQIVRPPRLGHARSRIAASRAAVSDDEALKGKGWLR
jgi:hypothetical protein